MSDYKIEVGAECNIIGGSWTENIDLVEDWGYDEEEAAEIIQKLHDQVVMPKDFEDALLETAREISGFDWWAAALWNV